MKELEKNYNPADIEARLYQKWLDSKYFHADAERGRREGKKPFTIVMPPPNTLFTTSASESPEKAEACVPCVVVGPSEPPVPLPRAAVTFSARSPILAYIQFPGQDLLANQRCTVSTISSDFGS